MTKITINNNDLTAAQTTTCDPDLHRTDITYATENEVAGSYDPGIPNLKKSSDNTRPPCIGCGTSSNMSAIWSYCPYCGGKL